MNVVAWFEVPKNRKLLYKVAVAGGLVLVATGVVEQSSVDQVLTLLGGVLLSGSAAVAHKNVNE